VLPAREALAALAVSYLEPVVMVASHPALEAEVMLVASCPVRDPVAEARSPSSLP
jgi:hypothetical protein